MTRRDVVVLGSTGSIGTQALDVVPRQPRPVPGRRAHRRRQQPRAVPSSRWTSGLRPAAATHGSGRGRLVRGRRAGRATSSSTASPARSGSGPTLAALDAGNTLALANKESLIIGGPLVTEPREARPDRPGRLRALARSRSACAAAPPRRYAAWSSRRAAARSAAGRSTTWPASRSRRRWPTRPGPWARSSPSTPRRWSTRAWRSSRRTCCSAIPFDRIEVVVHPTSVVHSMVEFVDGSTLVQASPPTMLIPIALGLAWPDRVPDTAPPVDWTSAGDLGVLPARRRGVSRRWRWRGRPGAAGSTAPAVYNAANEVCVEAFRTGRLEFRRSCPRSPTCLRGTTYPRGSS